MVTIRVPPEQWGVVWRALVAAGPVSRVSQEPIYVVSERQVEMLRRKKLPFEIISGPNGAQARKKHG
ncbi:MAG: hypothetical protein FJ271_18555 [Planctomycetes bacterium]|nr:hypothetical protein [Planctomycetota bacterium]